MKTWIPIFNPILHYYSLEKLIIMTKFLIILIALYFLYYIGNIVYDLFIKKESTMVTEISDVFSLAEFEEQNRDDVTTVGIEDVENLNTPKSFNKREFPLNNELPEEREDIEVWRQRFESEQNIDSFDSETLQSEILDNVSVENNTDEIEESVNANSETIAEIDQIPQKVDKVEWQKMLNDAETNVQLVLNNNGHKVYQAI